MKIDLDEKTVIIILLLIGTIGLATGYIIYDETGLHLGHQPLGDNGFFTTDNDTSAPPSGDPYIPSDPYLTLEVTPAIVQRTEPVTLTVTSNMRNVPIKGSLSYVDGTDTWIDSEDTAYLDAYGMFTQTMPSDNAGEWNLKVECASAGIESNIEHHTCLGITIYQEKDQWHVGETYTGFLTGTYKNWLVTFWFKNHTDTAWTFVTASYSNAWGMIPYGTLSAGPIVSEQVGQVLDVIAIIEVNDPEASEYIPYLMEEYQSDTIPESGFDSLEAQGYILKSNILTAYLVS